MSRNKGGSRLASQEKEKRRPAGKGSAGGFKGWMAVKGHRVAVIILAVLLAVVLGGVAAFQLLVRTPEIPTPGGTIKNPGASDVSGDDTDTGEDLGELMNLGADRKKGYYTFLICGKDTGGGGNTDTMMLVSYDTKNQKVAFLSLPRDTMINVTWRTKKLNSVYNVNGIQGLKEQVGLLTGVVPDFYVIVEWEAVGALVDAIGGVDYDVPYEMNYDDPYQNLHIHQAKGQRHLSGEDAMQVIRWRKNNDGSKVSVGDTGRMEVQQNFMAAVVSQCLSIGNVTKVSQFAKIFQEYVETDLTTSNLIWFGKTALLGGIKTSDFQYNIMPYYTFMYGKLSYVLPYIDDFLTIVNDSVNPYENREITRRDVRILSLNKNGTFSITSGSLADSKLASGGGTLDGGGSSGGSHTGTTGTTGSETGGETAGSETGNNDGTTGSETGNNGSTTGGETGNNGGTTGGETGNNGGTTTGGETSNNGSTTGGETGNDGGTTGDETGNNGSTTGGETGNNGSTTGGETGNNGGTTGGETGNNGGTTGGETGNNGGTATGGETTGGEGGDAYGGPGIL